MNISIHCTSIEMREINGACFLTINPDGPDVPVSIMLYAKEMVLLRDALSKQTRASMICTAQPTDNPEE